MVVLDESLVINRDRRSRLVLLLLLQLTLPVEPQTATIPSPVALALFTVLMATSTTIKGIPLTTVFFPILSSLFDVIYDRLF